MHRRELLKKFAAIPFVTLAAKVGAEGKAVELRRDSKYILFVEAGQKIDEWGRNLPESWKGLEILIIPLNLQDGQTMEEAIALYEVKNG